MTRRQRLDRELVRRGLAETRSMAQAFIDESRVTVDGAPAVKGSAMIAPSQSLQVAGAGERWASRAGLKLEGALTALAISPAGRQCLDAGASTGGFTDVLLQWGAARVIAVDVGYGQLRWRLRTDPRVVVMDRTNVRYLNRTDIEPPPPSLVVADLSFISLRLVLPALFDVAAADADVVVMVKPQFEVGRDAVGRGGVVRDTAAWRRAIDGVVSSAAEGRRFLRGAVVSPVPGPSGNIEFFLHFGAEGSEVDPRAVTDALVESGAALATGISNDGEKEGR